MLVNAAIPGVTRSPKVTARNKILPLAATVVALTLQAPSASSVNTQEWLNTSAAVVGSVSKDGLATFANLTVGALAGVLKASAGVVSGSATTTDLPEGTNLYYTDARARAAITGTANRITVILGVVDISAAYVGQASLTTLGTITTGVWQGTAVADTYIASAATWNAKEPAIAAGTTAQYWRGDKSWQTLDKSAVGLGNVENTALSTWAGSTSITTLGTIGTGTWNATAIADGKIASALTGKTYNGLTLTAAAVGFTIAGGTTSKTLTVPLDASVSGTNTGDQTSVSGNAGTATALQTARTINTVSFDGTANIVVTAAAGTLTGATLAAGVLASSLTSVGTLATLTVTATITGSVSGNAATATALQNARTINGTSFDGTGNITVTAAAGTLTGTTLNSTVVTSSLTSVGTITTGVWTGTTIAVANGGTGVTTSTGSTNNVLSAAPTLTGTVIFSGAISLNGSASTMGIGVGAQPDTGLFIGESLTGLTGTGQFGILSRPKFSSGATTSGKAIAAQVRTAAAAYTMVTGYGLYVEDANVGAASAITTLIGLFVNDQTGGGTNKAIVTGLGTVEHGDNLKITLAGKGVYIKEGSNATMGVATLVLGTVTVSTTKVTANSRIFLTSEALGTISSPVAVAVTARTAGTSFTITSANLTDTSTIAWIILEPA